MRVMLLGAGGLLGRTVIATAPENVTLLPYRREQVDITNYPSVASTITAVRPDVVVNAAAYTEVDRAESEPSLAFRTNAEAVGHLGKVAALHGACVVHFSSDYVFDGQSSEPYPEEAPTNPVNVYGATKLAGEFSLRESGATALIIRTQWLFGTQGRSFTQVMWERARSRLQTRVVADQFGRPTYVRDLATAVWRLMALHEQGTFHFANTGVASWFDFAVPIFSRAESSDLLHPCTTKDYPAAAIRPKYSVLCTSRAQALLGSSFFPPWQDGLSRMFDEALLAGWQHSPSN